MNPQRSIEYLTGLIMGLFIGFGLDGVLAVSIRIANGLLQSNFKLTWWMLIPLPLLCGLFMSKAIADLHLEDY